VFANTNSVAFKNNGGLDWMVFQLDKRGRNQCTGLGITNLTSTLQFKKSTAVFSAKKTGLSMTAVSDTGITDITSEGSFDDVKVQRAVTNSDFCTKFNPIAPEEALAGITVIENTYMTYTAPRFCDTQTTELSYTLAKSNGASVD
jgi:hypothetical protein